MSLTTRLSAFALAGLAVVLASFSAALYVAAGVALGRQVAARSDAALHSLLAAVEVHPADVQWEPLERKLTLGGTADLDQVRWTVHDEVGRLIDRSANLDAGPVRPEDGPWSFAAWVVCAAQFEPEAAAAHHFDEPAAALPTDRTATKAAFTLTVAASHAPAGALLRQIAAALTTASLAVWLVAALAARAVCRRALRPVTAMAASARALGDDPAHRLAVAVSGDELEDLGRAFNGLLERLHAAHDRQRRFTGDAAHQLCTPLAAILGQLEVALRVERPAAEYRRVLGVVRRRADGMRQVVESLLFLARSGAAAPLDLEPLDLADWLADQRDAWAGHDRAGDMVWDIPTGPVAARVHAGLLAQALDNLIDNAAKYSDAGTPIRIGLSAGLDGVELAVEDRGCGVEPADRPHLGEPFFRAAAARRRGTPGVGLGLAVAQRVLAACSGEMRVESQPDCGSRFALCLPAASRSGDDSAPAGTIATTVELGR